MKIDLSCPVELRGYELLHDDLRNVRAYLQLYNLSDMRVESFQIAVEWISASQSDTIFYTVDQPRAPARTAFTVYLSTDTVPDADSIHIAFLSINFDRDVPSWTGDAERLIDIEYHPEEDGRLLNALMGVAGRDAVQFPRNTKDYWICVCGRCNRHRETHCARCRREKEFVLSRLTREEVLLNRAPTLPDTLAPEPIEPELLAFERRAAPPPIDARPVKGDDEEPAPPRRAEKRRAKKRRHRQIILRRTALLTGFFLIAVASVLLWDWLDAQKERALEVRPPTRIEERSSSSYRR